VAPIYCAALHPLFHRRRAICPSCARGRDHCAGIIEEAAAFRPSDAAQGRLAARMLILRDMVGDTFTGSRAPTLSLEHLLQAGGEGARCRPCVTRDRVGADGRRGRASTRAPAAMEPRAWEPGVAETNPLYLEHALRAARLPLRSAGPADGGGGAIARAVRSWMGIASLAARNDR
jgi:hypothetical protein